MVAFCRISDSPIRAHEPISSPDALVIQDPTVLHQIDVFSGLHQDGYLLINSSRSFADLALEDVVAGLQPARMLTVPGTEIARETVGRPIANAVLLGGFAALTGVVSIEALTTAIRDRFSGALAEGNVAGAERAFAFVRQEMRELAGVQAD